MNRRDLLKAAAAAPLGALVPATAAVTLTEEDFWLAVDVVHSRQPEAECRPIWIWYGMAYVYFGYERFMKITGYGDPDSATGWPSKVISMEDHTDRMLPDRPLIEDIDHAGFRLKINGYWWTKPQLMRRYPIVFEARMKVSREDRDWVAVKVLA